MGAIESKNIAATINTVVCEEARRRLEGGGPGHVLDVCEPVVESVRNVQRFLDRSQIIDERHCCQNVTTLFVRPETQ